MAPRLCRGVVALAATLLLAFGTAAGHAAPDETEVIETLRRSVEHLQSRGEVSVAGQRLLSLEGLPEIYERRGFRLLWTLPANEDALLGEIAAATGEGLNPEDYHFTAIRGALERRRNEPDSAAAAAAADLLMSDALIRLAAHLHRGKLDPSTAAPRWDLEGYVRGEPAAVVIIRIATGSAVASQLGELRPVQPMYGRLKAALARYRVVAEEGGWEPVPSGRTLQLGMDDPRMPALRRRLAATGDFPGIVVDSQRFEPALEQAVRRFQARHRLEVDGVVGPASLAEMNRPVEEHMDTLRANLERARWLLTDVRGRFLVVDPAGPGVVLMDNSQPVVELAADFSPLVTSAGEFRAELRYLVAHADWVLPTQLVASQVAPLARRAPTELRARGLEVFDARGNALDPARADWSRPSGLIVRQLPGPQSFLGGIRYPVSGQPTVFLHGGSSGPGVLAGSVRVVDPAALAVSLAEPATGLTAETVTAVLAAGVPRTLPFARGIPVLFGPWTAWIGEDGAVYFRRGYEARDTEILEGLRAEAANR